MLKYKPENVQQTEVNFMHIWIARIKKKKGKSYFI